MGYFANRRAKKENKKREAIVAARQEFRQLTRELDTLIVGIGDKILNKETMYTLHQIFYIGDPSYTKATSKDYKDIKENQVEITYTEGLSAVHLLVEYEKTLKNYAVVPFQEEDYYDKIQGVLKVTGSGPEAENLGNKIRSAFAEKFAEVSKGHTYKEYMKMG